MKIIIKTIFLLSIVTLLPVACSAKKQKKIEEAKKLQRASVIEALEEIELDDSIPEDTGS